MQTNIFAWDEVPTVGDPTADRRVIAGAAGDLKRVAVKAGYMAARHAHDFEQFFMVLEGTGILTTIEGDVALKPGVVVHFAPDAWHSAVFHDDTVLVEVNFKNVNSKRSYTPRSVECEVNFDHGDWRIASVGKILELRDAGKTDFHIRCVECSGKVRAHEAGDGLAAHFEHIGGHVKCSLSDKYDGKIKREHPSPITR